MCQRRNLDLAAAVELFACDAVIRNLMAAVDIMIQD
jgi:hypothetical protein